MGEGFAPLSLGVVADKSPTNGLHATDAAIRKPTSARLRSSRPLITSALWVVGLGTGFRFTGRMLTLSVRSYSDATLHQQSPRRTLGWQPVDERGEQPAPELLWEPSPADGLLL